MHTRVSRETGLVHVTSVSVAPSQEENGRVVSSHLCLTEERDVTLHTSSTPGPKQVLINLESQSI